MQADIIFAVAVLFAAPVIPDHTGLGPQDAEIFVNEGARLADSGHNEKAIAAFDKAIELDPGLTGAYCGKGDVLSKIGRSREAISAYTNAVKLDPGLLNSPSVSKCLSSTAATAPSNP